MSKKDRKALFTFVDADFTAADIIMLCAANEIRINKGSELNISEQDALDSNFEDLSVSKHQAKRLRSVMDEALSAELAEDPDTLSMIVEVQEDEVLEEPTEGVAAPSTSVVLVDVYTEPVPKKVVYLNPESFEGKTVGDVGNLLDVAKPVAYGLMEALVKAGVVGFERNKLNPGSRGGKTKFYTVNDESKEKAEQFVALILGFCGS